MSRLQVPGDLVITGDLSVGSISLPANSVTAAAIGANADIARSKLAQEAGEEYPIPFTWFRVWNDMNLPLPSTSLADDLGIYGGTYGTDAPTLRTYDVKTVGATTLYGRVIFSLPPEYDQGQTVTLRVRCKTSAAADATATIDASVYKYDGDGAVGSDLVSTSAQSCNTTSYTNYDFVVTATTLIPGSQLDIRLAFAINDGSGGAPVVGYISSASMLLDIRG